MLVGELLKIQGVQKSFDGIFALSGVTFDVKEGECLALVGENGAGKSTLMKILSGVWPHGSYLGEFYFKGKPVHLKNPLEGRKAGISIIHQELCLFSELTVGENLFLTESYPYTGAPSLSFWNRVHWEELFSSAGKLFQELGFNIDPRKCVKDLSVAERQLVEIARAFHQGSQLLILDEPTSALSNVEVVQLFHVIRRMRQTSMSFIYISHKLDEVFELADRIVVLRDGQTVAHLQKNETNTQEVIRHMVGRPLRDVLRSSSKTPKVVLEVLGLCHTDPNDNVVLDGISFSANEGEILGIAGLMGSGRSELLRSLLGILPGTRSGIVRYYGKEVCWKGVLDAFQSGVGFVPEDRKKDGLFLDHGIDFNLTLSTLRQFVRKTGFLDLSREKSVAMDRAKRMRVRLSNIKDPVKTLSGGNQQKVLLAKVVGGAPKVLLLDEPTRGIDVGAKEEIYEIIRSLASEGMTILLVSSELPEVLSLSDRVIVLREGKQMGELVNQNLTQERVMSFAAGEKQHGVG